MYTLGCCFYSYFNMQKTKSQILITQCPSLLTVYPDVLIPGSDGCPRQTIGCSGLGCPNTCFCEDRCTWEQCSLLEPPEECLRNTNSTWHYELEHWTAKSKGVFLIPNFYWLRIINTFGFSPVKKRLTLQPFLYTRKCVNDLTYK